MPSPKPMTKAQVRELVNLWKYGYASWPVGVYAIPRHRPLGALCDMGLAEFADSVPRGGWLTTMGYLPTWADPIC